MSVLGAVVTKRGLIILTQRSRVRVLLRALAYFFLFIHLLTHYGYLSGLNWFLVFCRQYISEIVPSIGIEKGKMLLGWQRKARDCEVWNLFFFLVVIVISHTKIVII
jgi:hypothetical protein